MLEFADYHSHPAYKFRRSAFNCAKETLRLLPSLVRSTVIHLRELPLSPDYKNGAKSDLAQQFYQDGYLEINFRTPAAHDLFACVRDVLEPWRDQHRAIPAECRTMWNALRDLPRADHKNLYACVNDYLPSEASEVLRTLLGNDQPTHIQLSNFMADDTPLFRMGSDHLTRYSPWHVDPVIKTLKIIVYLSDVTQNNGPFHYLKASHLLNDSIFDRVVMHAHRFTFSGKAGWTWFNDEANRRRFAALPGFLQKKNTIGADFIENWVMLDSKMDDIQTLKGPAGSAALFDPLGIHRGGQIENGERTALILIFSYPKHS